jgi:hypothetical protein
VICLTVIRVVYYGVKNETYRTNPVGFVRAKANSYSGRKMSEPTGDMVQSGEAGLVPADVQVKRWLAFAAMKIAAEILTLTASAPRVVRGVIEHPSQVDLAIVARLADLLGHRSARLEQDAIPAFDFPALTI